LDAENIDTDKQVEILRALNKEELVKLLLLQVRNVWRVDGLYFLGIEEKFGVEAATEIDKNTWKILAKIEAKDLLRTFRKEKIDGIKDFMELLLKTGWALYQEEKRVEYESDKEAVFKIVRCKVQETRIKKRLGIFPCKPVRLGYLQEFTKTISPEIQVEVLRCPPDEKDPNFWCGWRFTLRKYDNKESRKANSNDI